VRQLITINPLQNIFEKAFVFGTAYKKSVGYVVGEGNGSKHYVT